MVKLRFYSSSTASPLVAEAAARSVHKPCLPFFALHPWQGLFRSLLAGLAQVDNDSFKCMRGGDCVGPRGKSRQ